MESSIRCTWDPQPPTPGSVTATPGQYGVRDPVVWTQEELEVLSNAYVIIFIIFFFHFCLVYKLKCQ
jgi:hypothetical protein